MEDIIIKIKNRAFNGKLKEWQEALRGTFDIKIISEEPYTISCFPNDPIVKENMIKDDVTNSLIRFRYLQFLNTSLRKFMRDKRVYEVTLK